MDPMEEKRRNAMRRKAADTLHALARKIEFGDYDVTEVSIEREIERDEGGPPAQVLEKRPTGRETLRVIYTIPTPGRRR